jgi:hypothetical protein
MGKPRNSRFINLSDKETLKTLLLDLRPANDVSKEESEDKIGKLLLFKITLQL